MRILPRKRQDRLIGAVARLFGGAAGGIALDDKEFRALRGIIRAIRELSGQAQLARRALARDVLFRAAAQPVLGALDRPVDQALGLRGRGGEPMVESVAHGALDDARGFRAHQPAFVLALEFRLADEDGNHRGAAGHEILGRDGRRALALADAVGVFLEPAQQREAQAGFMRAAVGGRNGVAIGMDETVVLREPGDRPFQRAVALRLFDAADEKLLGDQFLALDIGREIVLEAAGKVEHRLGRRLAVRVEQRRRAFPADFDAAEQIGLGPRHLENARGGKFRGFAENLRVGLEPDLGAAPVGDPAQSLQPGDGRAARKDLAIEVLAARDLDLQPLGQSVDDGNADAVQAAGGLIGPGIEFAAGMERRHDHFQRGFLGEFRVRIDRNAAPVVGHGQEAVLVHRDVDAGGVAGHRLVHGIVEHFGEEMMQGGLVRAADIHARAPAHRLQSLQNLDRGRRIAGFARRAAGKGLFRFGGFLARRGLLAPRKDRVRP